MTPPRLRYRVQASFWQHNRPLRRLGRFFRQLASLTAFRVRQVLEPDLPQRVVTTTAGSPSPPVCHPAITLLLSSNDSPEEVATVLSSQTETSIEVNLSGAPRTPFCLIADPGIGMLPPTHLESLLMAAAAEHLGWVVGGWSAPAEGRFGPSGTVWRDAESSATSCTLFRVPGSKRRVRPTVLGRTVAHIRDAGAMAQCTPLEQLLTVRSGPYRLRPDRSTGAIVRQPVHEIDQVLSDLPDVDGPPTVMFLLPFLAIGGAEKLLRDLIGSMRARFRILVVTTDPHLEQLGQTVESSRQLTPHVYTLGDWIPQLAVPSAICHLLRRWKVRSLMCWNGNVMFFDHVADLKRRFPSLRIINQLFNHEGGWIEHYCPSVVDNIDCHVAVNTTIARTLVRDRSVPENKVIVLRHGVDIPEFRPSNEVRLRGAAIREQLGIPADVPLVGTFIRLHPQKRPHDVIRLARELSPTGVHFLLVGDGPMTGSIDRELTRRPLGNLTRLPMQEDPMDLYDAIDICLMTSSFEGLPVFLLDGLARGIPCVATAVGDIPFLLENGGGIAVAKPGDISGLAAAILSLVNDPDKRRREGESGRSRVLADFNLGQFVEGYEGVIFPCK